MKASEMIKALLDLTIEYGDKEVNFDPSICKYHINDILYSTISDSFEIFI